MWCMLNIFRRSTHHMAMVCPTPDIVHCPPPADKSLYRPSTALSAPQGCPGYGANWLAGLFKARFSVVKSKMICKPLHLIIQQKDYSDDKH